MGTDYKKKEWTEIGKWTGTDWKTGKKKKKLEIQLD